METRAVLEEVVSRQLVQIVDDLHSALSPEFERQRIEKEALAQHVEELQPMLQRQRSAACGGRSATRGLTDVTATASAPADFFLQPLAPAKGRTVTFEDSAVAEDSPDGSEAMSPGAGGPVEGTLSEGRTRWNPEDHYENLYDLTRAFRQLCRHGRSTLSVDDIVEMSAQQKGMHPLDVEMVDLCARLERTVKTMNRELSIPVSPDSLGGIEVHLGTFIAIMQRNKEFYRDLDSSLSQAAIEVRDILVKEGTLRMVARATNTTCRDMYMDSATEVSLNRSDQILHYLDPFIGLVIILNALVTSISTDVAYDSEVWLWLEVTFTFVFLIELCIKLVAHGFSHFFCGPDLLWNFFDTLVVCIATADIVLSLLGNLVNLGNFTIIRLLRFARLTKLVRVLRLKIFKELALMVNGLLAGLRVLVWAVVFLGFLLFCLGVLLTRTFGHEDANYWRTICNDVEGKGPQRACENSADHLGENSKQLFGNVFRSTFTVFRCFTDGCVSVDGTPLVPYFYNTHGIAPVLMYMIVILFVTFGLFNLIMAIFVEDTIDSAKRIRDRRREERYKEDIRLANRLQRLVVMFCTDKASLEYRSSGKPTSYLSGLAEWIQSAFSTRSSPDTTPEELLTKSMAVEGTNLCVEVHKATFDEILQRPEVQTMLDELDIESQSRQSLFEILDANCDGSLEVNELIGGLLKLRGSDSKGDSVASLLAIRSMQRSIKAMEVLSLHQQQEINRILEMQKDICREFEESASGPLGKRAKWQKKVARSAGFGLDAMESAMVAVNAPVAAV